MTQRREGIHEEFDEAGVGEPAPDELGERLRLRAQNVDHHLFALRKLEASERRVRMKTERCAPG